MKKTKQSRRSEGSKAKTIGILFLAKRNRPEQRVDRARDYARGIGDDYAKVEKEPSEADLLLFFCCFSLIIEA